MAVIEPGLGFGPGTVVRAYWLRRCVDFRVLGADGRYMGTVKSVAADDAGLVLVCRRRLRSTTLRANGVDTVWPAQALLVLGEHRPEANPLAVPAPTLAPARSDRGAAGREGAWAALATARARAAARALRVASARAVVSARRRLASFLIGLARRVEPPQD